MRSSSPSLSQSDHAAPIQYSAERSSLSRVPVRAESRIRGYLCNDGECG
jgi:hypothetical protein